MRDRFSNSVHLNLNSVISDDVLWVSLIGVVENKLSEDERSLLYNTVIPVVTAVIGTTVLLKTWRSPQLLHMMHDFDLSEASSHQKHLKSSFLSLVTLIYNIQS